MSSRPSRPARPAGLAPSTQHAARLLVTRTWHSHARAFSCHGIPNGCCHIPGPWCSGHGYVPTGRYSMWIRALSPRETPSSALPYEAMRGVGDLHIDCASSSSLNSSPSSPEGCGVLSMLRVSTLPSWGFSRVTTTAVVCVMASGPVSSLIDKPRNKTDTMNVNAISCVIATP